MAEDWYPIIDEGKCDDNCFKCVTFCPKHVFSKDTTKPIVKDPEACLKGCDSCKDICPKNAITFLKTKIINIGGQNVGLIGVTEIFLKYPDDFESAFLEISKENYIPVGAIELYKDALKKEFELFSKLKK